MSLAKMVKVAPQSVLNAKEPDHARLLHDLKEKLQEKMPASEIVDLMYDNSQRAKNEIKSTCRTIFEDDSWSMIPIYEKENLIEELIDGVFGFGPIEALLDDSEITEIMINGTKTLFYEKKGRLFQGENTFTDDDQVRSLIDRILSPLGRRIDEASPMVDARLPQGHRVNAIIHPLSLDGPILTIRKFGELILDIERLVQGGAVDKEVALLLTWAVTAKKNIAVTGGTGSGKTTVLNALSCVIPTSERIVTIEDSAELKFSEHPHVVRLESRPQNAEGKGKVTIKDLVVNSLRMRPDRIVVGECRGGEALDMLQAMNTGHNGSLTTLHANSPADSVLRLTTLVRYAAELPVDVIEAQIASAIDLVVHTVRGVDGTRFISEVASIEYQRGADGCTPVTHYKREIGHVQGSWFSVPQWVDTISEYRIAHAEEVARWRQALSIAA